MSKYFYEYDNSFSEIDLIEKLTDYEYRCIASFDEEDGELVKQIVEFLNNKED